jgi:hypothetical protein
MKCNMILEQSLQLLHEMQHDFNHVAFHVTIVKIVLTIGFRVN